jgi:cytochrome c553
MRTNNTLFVLAACLLPLGLAAAPSSNVAWTVETHTLVKKGDARIGSEVELIETEDVNACADCHGEKGAEPDREKHPTLAGQLAP